MKTKSLVNLEHQGPQDHADLRKNPVRRDCPDLFSLNLRCPLESRLPVGPAGRGLRDRGLHAVGVGHDFVVLNVVFNAGLAVAHFEAG